MSTFYNWYYVLTNFHQPIEENAHIYFAQKQQESASNASMSSLEESYYTLIKLVHYIGLLFAAIASNYTYVLLSVLTGKCWSNNITDASNALSMFWFYVLTIALNGMTEAFVYGIISGTSNGSKSNKKLDVGKLGLVHRIGKLKNTTIYFLI